MIEFVGEGRSVYDSIGMEMLSLESLLHLLYINKILPRGSALRTAERARSQRCLSQTEGETIGSSVDDPSAAERDGESRVYWVLPAPVNLSGASKRLKKTS